MMNEVLKERKFEDTKALMPFLKRIFTHAYRYKFDFWMMVVTVLMVAVVDAIFPLFWLYFLDTVVTPQVLSLQEPDFVPDYSGLYWFGGLYVIVSLFNVICVGGFIYFTMRIRELVIFDLRKEMFNKLQQLSFSFYDKSAVGWLLSRMTSDADRVTELISWGFLTLVWGVAMILFCFIAMLIYSWKLALIVFAILPILFLLSIRIRKLILKYSREARRINSEITASFNENINGIEVNKSTAQEQEASGRFRNLSERMRQSSYRAQFYTAMYMPLVVMVGSIATALVIYFGGIMAISPVGGITIGLLAAFFGYSTLIFEPIFDITRFYALAQGSLSAGERIFSLIDEEIEIYDKPGVFPFGKIKGDIELKNVRFHYLQGKSILQDFNLNIKQGETIALVGPTGEGKTTITSLVCRFYEPKHGEILIDGVDYRECTLKSFREQLGIIQQTPHLFSGTIRQNILYGKLDAEDAQVKQALQVIGADDFIPRLDDEVGEEGSNLSTGEKQMISFARVVLKDPAILVLDEATSSVDTIAEAKIQKGIDSITKGRTSLIIAHRLSTIRNADRILVIKKGEILEEGNHNELMKQKGYYYRLYTRQSRMKFTDKATETSAKPS